jgi:hypothetical protein
MQFEQVVVAVMEIDGPALASNAWPAFADVEPKRRNAATVGLKVGLVDLEGDVVVGSGG